MFIHSLQVFQSSYIILAVDLHKTKQLKFRNLLQNKDHMKKQLLKILKFNLLLLDYLGRPRHARVLYT